jgi:hypothetical protein
MKMPIAPLNNQLSTDAGNVTIVWRTWFSQLMAFLNEVITDISTLNMGVSTLNTQIAPLLAKYERHIQLPLSAAFITGSGDATYGDVIAGKIANQNTDIFHVQYELFEDWDGTDCYLEIDWLPRTALTTGQTVIWIFTWRAIAEGEDADTGTAATATVTYTAPGAVSAGTTIHTRATLPALTGNQPLTDGDHLFIKLYRNATTDTWSGDCLCTAFEFIYWSEEFPRG